ncbi:MAG: hypothetical protein L0154_26540 [Chloroflexi bacterium]|nr:hypothetical protein [Chloroflexota bacterium]
MHRNCPRVYIVDQGDCVFQCVQRILHKNNCDDVVIHLSSYEQLLVSLQSRDFWGGQPVILMGRVRSDQHHEMFSLLKDFATFAHIPIIMVGSAHLGWVIQELLQRPNVCGYLHNEDHWEAYLVKAINRVRRHQTFLSPTAATLVELAKQSKSRKRRFAAGELQILTGMYLDMAACEIAEQTGMEIRNVYSTMDRLRHLFETSQRFRLLAAVERCGIYCHKNKDD